MIPNDFRFPVTLFYPLWLTFHHNSCQIILNIWIYKQYNCCIFKCLKFHGPLSFHRNRPQVFARTLCQHRVFCDIPPSQMKGTKQITMYKSFEEKQHDDWNKRFWVESDKCRCYYLFYIIRCEGEKSLEKRVTLWLNMSWLFSRKIRLRGEMGSHRNFMIRWLKLFCCFFLFWNKSVFYWGEGENAEESKGTTASLIPFQTQPPHYSCEIKMKNNWIFGNYFTLP